MKHDLLTAILLLASSLCCQSGRAAPARGYIDCRWNAGYVLRSSGHHECGRFVVCPGCSCLSPHQYRSFANLALPGSTQENVGGSWYAAGHGLGMTDLPVPAPPTAEAETIPIPSAEIAP